jgi:hypothetical protein
VLGKWAKYLGAGEKQRCLARAIDSFEDFWEGSRASRLSLGLLGVEDKKFWERASRALYVHFV